MSKVINDNFLMLFRQLNRRGKLAECRISFKLLFLRIVRGTQFNNQFIPYRSYSWQDSHRSPVSIFSFVLFFTPPLSLALLFSFSLCFSIPLFFHFSIFTFFLKCFCYMTSGFGEVRRGESSVGIADIFCVRFDTTPRQL